MAAGDIDVQIAASNTVAAIKTAAEAAITATSAAAILSIAFNNNVCYIVAREA